MKHKNLKIHDTLFYPLGLFNKIGGNKTVCVTWSFDCLYTCIFKQTGEHFSLENTYRVPTRGIIQDVIATKRNTLVLMQSGQIYFFSSCRNLKRKKFLNGVKCIASCKDEFALIRVDEDNSILLEIFEDFTEKNAVKEARKIFNITFDDANIFNSSWRDDRFGLLVVQVGAGNRRLLELITKCPIECNEVYLFSVFNNLFCLHSNNNQNDESIENNEENIYEINLLLTQSSQIEALKWVHSMSAILLYMSCGAIELIYLCRLTNALDRKMHVIGGDIVCSAFTDNSFFYSDGENVVQIEFFYNEKKYSCIVNEKIKPLPNIVALTWVELFKKLVCLSENNIFYEIKFSEKSVNECNKVDYFQLDDKKLQEIEQNLYEITNLIEEPNRILKEIEAEVFKQEILTIVKRKYTYISLAFATVNFYSHFTDLKEKPMFLVDSNEISLVDNYFVLISFKITWNEIFKNGLWNLVINLSNSLLSTSLLIRINESVIKKDFNVVIPMKKEKYLIPPRISIELASFISMEKDFMYVSLPVIMNTTDFRNFILYQPIIAINSNNSKHFSILDKYMIDLAKKNNPLRSIELSVKMFSVQLRTPLILSIDSLCEMLSIPCRKDVNMVDDNSELYGMFQKTLYLLGEEIFISYLENDNILQIKSVNPAALFYVKSRIIEGLADEFYDDEPVNTQVPLRNLLKLQCDIESRYGNEITDDVYAATLIRLYKQMRSEIKHF